MIIPRQATLPSPDTTTTADLTDQAKECFSGTFDACTAKLVIGFVIAAVVVVGIAWWWIHRKAGKKADKTQKQTDGTAAAAKRAEEAAELAKAEQWKQQQQQDAVENYGKVMVNTYGLNTGTK